MSVPVQIRKLCVELGGRPILTDVDLEVPAGSLLTLLGPSGSGKSTALNVLAGFTPARSGEVLLDGRPLTSTPAHKRGIGVVFQNYALFPHLTVGQNVAFPLRARKMGREERLRLADEALALVQLPGAAQRDIRSLSGGQQQRVALARALVYSPSLLLLDEPLAALDKQLRETMQLELKRIQQRSGVTTISVTHDQVEALSMSDRVAIMNRGRIEQLGTPDEVYRAPATRFVAEFLGEANLLPARGGYVELLGARVTSGAADGLAVVRPEDVAVCPQQGDSSLGISVELREITYQGSRVRMKVAAGGTELIVSVSPHEIALLPQLGGELRVAYRGTTLHAISEHAEAGEAA